MMNDEGLVTRPWGLIRHSEFGFRHLGSAI